VLVDDLAAATAFSNAYAPEHLELHLADPPPETSSTPAPSSSVPTRR
jgi:histidinol dehydrogenase